jgi:hypothetical protein
VLFMGGLLLSTPPYRCTGTDGGGGGSAGTTSAAAGTAGNTDPGGGSAGVSAGSGGSAGTDIGGTTGDTETGGATSAGTEAGGTTAGSEAGGTTAGSEAGGTTAGSEAGGTTAGSEAGGSSGSTGITHGTGYDTSIPGLVKDNQTGMVWEQLTDGSYPSLDWDTANTYCTELEHAGFDDWRLPSGAELFTLVQLESGASNHYDLTLFPNSPADSYWTSSVAEGFDESFRDALSFGSYEPISFTFTGAAPLYADPMYFEHPVRCVRGGDVPRPRFTDYGDGTALDGLTGLVWEQRLTFDVSLSEAQERCNTLELAGGGWRMPTLVELLGATSPDEAPLENSSWDGVPLWTSSRYVEAPPSQPGGWVLFEFDHTPQSYYGEQFDFRAKTRCVR